METRLVVTIDGRMALGGSRQINSAINTVRRNSRGMVREIDGSFKRLQQSLFSVRSAIAAVGITQFVRRAIGAFGDFEAGLVGVGKTANIEGKELQSLGKDIEQLALKIPIATDELLEIAQATGQLGVTGSANILKFTETIAKLGTASDLAGGEAAITLARILGLTGEATDSIDKMASALVALGNSAKASESEIAKVALEVSKGAAVFNISSANILGLSTTLKELGQQAEISRSTVQRTFQILQNATEDGGKKLELLGKITGQTGEQFKKAFKEDTFSAFLQFIKGLGKTGDQSVKTLRALGLNSLQINAVLPVLGKNFALLESRVKLANTAYAENVALNEEAAKAFATFNSAMKIVSNNLTFAFKIVGGELAPAFKTLGESIKEIAQSDGLKIFARSLGVAFGFLADNIKLVILALGLLTLRATIGLVIKLTTGVIGLANALKIGAAASIAQAAGLNRASLAANLFTASSARSAISIRNVGVRAKIAGTALFVLDAALGLIGLSTATLGGLFGRLGGALTGVTGFIGRLVGGISSILPGFLSMATLSTAAGFAVRGLAVAFGILTGPIGLTVAAVVGLIAIYNTFEDTLIQVGDLNASIGSIIQATWEVATTEIGKSIFEFVTNASAKWEVLKKDTSEKFAAISSVIKEKMSSALDSIKSFLQPAIDVFNKVKNAAKEKFQGIVDIARNIVQPVVDKFNTIKKKIIEAFTGAFSSIREKFSNFVDKAFPGFVDKVVKKANELEEAKKNIKDVGNVAEDTAKKIKKATDTLKEGDFIGPRLPSKTDENIPRATDIRDFDVDVYSLGLGGKIKDEFTESDRLTEQFVGDFENTFKNGINSIFKNGRSGFKDMIGGFRSFYFDLLTEVAARPILDFLLGKSSSAFGGRSGGPVSGVLGNIFGKKQPVTANAGGIGGKVTSATSPIPVSVVNPATSNILPGDVILGDEVANAGGDFADVFSQQSQNSGGFLGKLGGIFTGGGEGGGFLSSMGGLFDKFTSGISGVFGGLGGGGGSGAGGTLSTIGGIAGNFLLPGVGGFIGSALGSVIGGFFADGGSVKGKTPIIVGERGPELFVPPVNGEIIPNDKLSNIIPFPADIIRASNDNDLSPDMMKKIANSTTAGNFAGFFADGGSVKAGRKIIGGEKGPELFIPSSASNNNGGDSDSSRGDTVIVNMNINTPEATSFKRSQGQLASQAAQSITRARRNL